MRLWLLALCVATGGVAGRAATCQEVLHQAQAAEAESNLRRALELYLEADRLSPHDAVVLQKVAQQYSDLANEMPTDAEKKAYAEQALGYATQAAQIDPRSAINQLSLAICHGKLAEWSPARVKVAYSRLVKAEAEQALALDPNYAWAHDVVGRWNYEVASLNGAERFFIRLVYGGLPDASYDEAIAQLDRAAALDPAEPVHRLELGFAYLAAGRKAEACAQFDRGLAMPGHKKFDEEEKQRARLARARLAASLATNR